MAPIKTFVGKFAKAAFTVAAPSSTQQKGDRSPMIGPASISSPNAAMSTYNLEKMCRLFKAEPVDNLYLSTGGERGVCLTKPILKGDPILSIPISSCFRDDEPPRWYERSDDEDLSGGFVTDEGKSNGDDENDITDYERYNPSAWASRLAASLVDMELVNHEGEVDINDDLKEGREIWSSMLPDKDILRASLPVHWGEEVLATSKCTALDVGVDSAYFARASAVMNLSEELKQALDKKDGEKGELSEDVLSAVDVVLDMDTLQRKCHDALDIVQTRACRVERTAEGGVQWGPPLRILAPIFDFINHGSSRMQGEGSANANFGIENSEKLCCSQNAKLVVRAVRDMVEGEEVLIDYGDSARPAWRCLTSYGFVPEYDVNSEVEVVDEEHVENVAELWMNGLRFEVDTQSVPFDLVEVAAAQALLDHSFDDDDHDGIDEEEAEAFGASVGGGAGMLTPFVARAIAKRATEAAFNLVTEPEMVNSEEDWDSPEFVHAMSLAALLRWSQHKVLLAFAENLELFSSSSLEGE